MWSQQATAQSDLEETDNISATMAKFYLARIDTANKTAADFQAEAAVVFGKALDDLYEQCHNSFCNISTFVSTTPLLVTMPTLQMTSASAIC